MFEDCIDGFVADAVDAACYAFGLVVSIWSTGSESQKLIGTAPIDSAILKRSGTWSTAYTADAPRRIAEYAARRPTGPEPNTATESPGSKPEKSRPAQAVAKISPTRR